MTTMQSPQPLAKIWMQLREKINPGIPSFFSLRARLPSKGRFDAPVAATRHMTVVLKTYAAGGENTLHAHVNEDHVFFVLQGGAIFKGPKGETRSVEKYDGVMLPKGSFYSFESSSQEPLVMLRVGSVDMEASDAYARVGMDGLRMSGMSVENKHVDPVFSDAWFGRVQRL